MSFCALCGLTLTGDEALCPHHVWIYENEWATSNRMWCAFFHRGVALPRPEHDGDPWLEMLRTAPWSEV